MFDRNESCCGYYPHRSGCPYADNDIMPDCPICGAECDSYHVAKRSGEIVGCDECLESIDAWDVVANAVKG